MQHFDYDIFISYRRHDKKSLDNINENAGTNIARALYYALINKGYKVYFDCVLHGATQSDTIMEKSKLVLLLVSDYTFCDADGWDDNNRIGGLHKEMFWLCQRFGITQNDNALTDNQKKSIINPVILPVNVDKALDDDSNLPCYKWLTSLGRVNLHTDEDFDIFFNDLIAVLQGGKPEFKLNIQPSCPTRDSLEQKLADANRDTELIKKDLREKRKELKKASVGVLFLIIVVLCFLVNALLPVIVIVGQNTVSEYLESKGMSLNNSHRKYIHLKSDEAWKALGAAVRRYNEKAYGFFPIVLTTDENPDPTLIKDIKELNSGSVQCRILKYEIDQVDLALYVLDDATKKGDGMYNTCDTINKDLLIKLLKDTNYYVIGPDSNSNITKAFDNYIKDPTFEIKKIIREKFRKYDTASLNRIRSSIGQSKRIIVLDNSTVESDTSISKHAKKMIVPDNKMHLYAYTLVKVVGKDCKHAKMEFFNGQEWFFFRKQMNWAELKLFHRPQIKEEEFPNSVIVICRKSSY